MDNVMRTDRVRDSYFVKDTHILARQTMRYNRGFIYLQETIDRAIIEAQIGQKVTEPAVQLQPFPYPCFQRDEWVPLIHGCRVAYIYVNMHTHMHTAWTCCHYKSVHRNVKRYSVPGGVCRHWCVIMHALSLFICHLELIHSSLYCVSNPAWVLH